jgi:hypothetical protein
MTIQGAIEEIKMLEVPFYAEPIKAKIIETIIDECRDYYYQGKAETIDEFAKYIDKHSHVTKDGCDIALDDDITILAEQFKEQNNEY